jgi:hypothetical protein
MAKRYPQASPLLQELADAIDLRQIKKLWAVLKKGVDVNAKLNGYPAPTSPFRRAVDANSDEIALALLDAGATPEPAELNLVWAARTGRADVVRKFIAMGADPDVTTMMGTPINVAARHGNLDIVRLLIDAGADVNAGSSLGTPLQHAAEQGFTDVALALLAAGASLEPVRGTDSAAKRAKDNGHAQVVAALKAAAARPRKPGGPKTNRPSPPAARSVKAMLASPRESIDGVPDFTARAKRPAYAKAVEALAALCGTRPQPMNHAAGGFTFHLHSRQAKSFDLLRVHRDFLKRRDGYVYATDSKGNTIAILPTTDVAEVVQTMATNGNNYGIGQDEVIAWVRKTVKSQPIVFTGIGFDFLDARFTGAVNDPARLAKEVVELCPDAEDVGAVVNELRERLLFLWWD